jgi:hypothetical protein
MKLINVFLVVSSIVEDLLAGFYSMHAWEAAMPISDNAIIHYLQQSRGK